MNCPHCNNPIDNKLISKTLASKGGKKSKKGKRPDLKTGGDTWLRIHRPDCRIDPDSIVECNLGTKGCFINHKASADSLFDGSDAHLLEE